MSTKIIIAGNGSTLTAQFEPAMLESFKGCLERFRDIFEAHRAEA